MKRLIFVGKAASGKDHARKVVEAAGAKYAVSFTTRPPREGEVQAKDYFFLDPAEFEHMINKDEMYEYVEFNGWYYGTTNKQMEECNSFIMTPLGLSHLTPQDRKESFVVYFNIDELIRRERMDARQGNADSVERRIIADEEDFSLYTNYDLVISDPNYTDETIVSLFKDLIEKNNDHLVRNTRTLSRTIIQEMNIKQK
jgi:guanylate kinase